MEKPVSDIKFKGDDFQNRYRIQGVLTARSPVHIGTGDSRDDNEAVRESETAEDKPPQIDEIVRNLDGMPYLPGSSLRGVVRNYLLQIFRPFGNRIAEGRDYETDDFKNRNQNENIDYARKNFSLLEMLFGTPISETKIDFLDAYLVNKVSGKGLAGKGWDEPRQTYVVRSVAINPVTGAAERNKLYSFDVIPQGLQFEINIEGQNLSNMEAGMLLFGLYGFNSEIFRLTLGAMAGRGFGRFSFALKNIYCLTRENLSDWTTAAATSDHAGFDLVPKVEEAQQEALRQEFKQALIEKIGD